MSTGEVIGLVVLAGGGYYLYNKYYAPAATQPYTPVVTTPPVKITPGKVQDTNVTIVNPGALKAFGLAGINNLG